MTSCNVAIKSGNKSVQFYTKSIITEKNKVNIEFCFPFEKGNSEQEKMQKDLVVFLKNCKFKKVSFTIIRYFINVSYTKNFTISSKNNMFIYDYNVNVTDTTVEGKIYLKKYNIVTIMYFLYKIFCQFFKKQS